MARREFNCGWAFRRKVSAFQELGGSAGAEWQDVTLPHDAVIGLERDPGTPRGETTGWFPGGAFEYRTSLQIDDADRGKPQFLEFGGVYRDAMVFVNGALAGQHPYGYSRFVVRIDPYLTAGAENQVRVECRAHLDSRWYSGAGIHRDVHLIVKDPVHIAVDGVRVTTSDIDEHGAIVAVAVDTANAGLVTSTLGLTAVLLDPDGAEVARDCAPVTVLPGDRGTARHRLYVPRPQLWSVDSPSLYQVRVELRDGQRLVDSEDVAVGIRSLQVDPAHGLRINGEVVALRGACIHSDNGPLGAASIRRAEERRVELLKAAGFNAIRSAHNPISPALLDACDRLGLLVMDETFDMWTSAKSDFDHAFDFATWWERDLEALVAKDVNHPSVVFYSIGNEIPETGHPHGAVWGRRLAEKVRSLDSTRFVTNGINPFVSMLDVIVPQMQQQRAAAEAGGGVNAMMADVGSMMARIQASEQATERTAESFAVLDVAGMNYADARYAADRDLFPNRVIVGAETWPAQIAGNWALVTENPHVIGDFTWTGWDYLGETGIGVVRYADESGSAPTSFSGDYPGLTAGCGDLDITGGRRPVSFYREIVFGLRSTPYIAVARPDTYDRAVAIATPWSWSDTVASWTWDGYEGRSVNVEVYSAAEEVELLLDDAPIARAAVGATRSFTAEFDIKYQPGTLTGVSYTGGIETGRTSLATAGPELVLLAVADRTELIAGTGDLAFVELVLTDARGVLQPGRDREVVVTVDGPAVLQAMANGHPSDPEPFGQPSHRTRDGRVLAIVRPTVAGQVRVTATATDCPPVTLTLTVR